MNKQGFSDLSTGINDGMFAGQHLPVATMAHLVARHEEHKAFASDYSTGFALGLRDRLEERDSAALTLAPLHPSRLDRDT